MKILQCQTHVSEDKKANLDQMRGCFEEAARCGADLITFGEMFTCPYETKRFPLYAEEEGGESFTHFASLAREYGILVSAGSIPEKAAEKDGKTAVYNTAYVFDRKGQNIAKHRKMHLFDIAVRGGQAFRESETLTGGKQVTVFDTEFGRMGLCICFDLRFPGVFLEMARQGAVLVLVPAAFNPTTGPAHWELLFRARALDNQCFLIGTSPAQDPAASYHAYGHSIITDPWGTVLSQTDEKAGTVLTEIDLARVQEIREQLPVLSAAKI